MVSFLHFGVEGPKTYEFIVILCIEQLGSNFLLFPEKRLMFM